MTIPNDLVLEGERVRIEPLAVRHLSDIIARCANPALREFTFQPNPLTNEPDAREWLEKARGDDSVRSFAIVERASGAAIGSTRYLDIVPKDRKLEIGWTFLARDTWRTGINSECKLLLLGYAFDEWNAIRAQLKADSINMRSRDAIGRLGATCEGTLRDCRIRPDGQPRGITYFSILAAEWPAVQRRFAARCSGREPRRK